MILLLLNYSLDVDDFNESFHFRIGHGGTMTFEVLDWDIFKVEFVES